MKPKPPRFVWIIVPALLWLFFLQVVTAIPQNSITSDEGPQLISGYSFLVTGDRHLIEFDGHPPFAKVVNALPLLAVPDFPDPTTAPAWISTDPISLTWMAEQLIYPYRPLDRLVVPARVMVALLGLLLGALVYRWTADLFGPLAGVGALLLVTFDPNLLAHAGLATNDLAATAWGFAALFTFWRWLRRPAPWRLLLAGVVLGLAQSTKLNALLLLPTQAGIALFYLIAERRRLWPLVRQGFLLWLVAGLTLWATYGFELRALPGMTFPVPAGTHGFLLQQVAKVSGGGHPAFLMGELSTQGWWYYFPLAFAIKTPLPTLLILGAALVTFALGRRRRWRHELALGLFVLLYTAVTLRSHLNIGYRHLLPVLPFLYTFAGRLLAPGGPATGPARLWRYLGGGLALWLAIGTLAIWPFPLAFFNEVIGGPDQGYHYLVDSNTDWGQAIKALQRFMAQEGIARVKLSTFFEYGAAIEGYEVAFDPLPPLHAAPGVLPARFNPAPGVYVLSSTTLQGIFLADGEMYDWFRQREPDALIGHVMPLYRVEPPVVTPGWVAQCTAPVAPLSPEVVAEGFGRDDLRLAYFDCTTGWLYPGGGQQPGWYAFFRETARRADPFIQARLTAARLSYEQKQTGLTPSFAIYEQPLPLPQPATAVEPPVKVGALRFLGYRVPNTPLRPGETVEIETWWQVTEVPTRPLSIMLHLQGPAGAPVLVGDGLGVPVDTWQVGDWIMQRHTLALPAEAPAGVYTPVTGVYWLDSLERWQPAGMSTDNLTLSPLTVKRR